MEKKKGGKLKKGLLWTGLIVALCGIVFGACSLANMQEESSRAQAEAESLRSVVVSSPTPAASLEPVEQIQPTPAVQTPAPSKEPEMWYDAYAAEPDREIDFEALAEINEDVCGWITVPGTEIDYPMVYAPKGVGHYLNHSFEGESSKYGTIFTDDYNARDFSDPVTFVYGHNMRDGSMFAGLHKFEDAMFFDEYDTIKIYTPEHMFVYEIIAAYKTGDENIIALNDFTDEEVLSDYQEGIYEVRDMNANLRDASLTVDDRLLVLATCVSGDDDARYLVHGRLKENE